MALGAVLAFVGCNSVLGIEKASLDPSLGTGGTGTGGFGGIPASCESSPGDTPCAVCDQTSCCNELMNCVNEPDCVAIVNCLSDCTDSTCTAACYSDHPTGAPLDTAWSGCLSSKCGSQCSGSTCAAAPDPALVESCVVAMSCDPWPFTNIANCISLGSVYAVPYLACANGAQSCEQIGACLGRFYGDKSLCAGAGSGWLCAGSIAQNCESGTPEVVNCSFWGATCSPGVAWPCVDPNTPCSDADNLWHCSGNTAYFCSGGLRHVQDCSVEQSVCVEKTAGQAYCSHSVSTCSDYDVQACSGNSMTYCNTDGYLYEYDCGASSGTCQNFSSTGAGYCFSPGCAPDAQCDESCSGSVMTLCVGQAPTQVDCKDYGFSACSTYDAGGYTAAVCVK
jgi:hypothetical protein